MSNSTRTKTNPPSSAVARSTGSKIVRLLQWFAVLAALVLPATVGARTITVGPSAEYATLNEALRIASGLRPEYVQMGESVKITLTANYVMREQILVERADFGFVEITNDRGTVTDIELAYLSKKVQGYFPAFSAHEGAVLPVISARFRMIGAPKADSVCVLISANSRGTLHVSYKADNTVRTTPGCDLNARGGTGLVVVDNSVVHAREAHFTHAITAGAVVANASMLSARAANLSDSGGTCLIVDNASRVEGKSMSLLDCREHGALIKNASSADLLESTISAGKHGAFVQASTAQLMKSKILAATTNAKGVGIYADQGAYVNASYVLVQPGAQFSVLAASGSSINAMRTKAKGATDRGCYALDASTINLHAANCLKTGKPSPLDIYISRGSFINATKALGGLSSPPNTLTRAGVISQ